MSGKIALFIPSLMGGGAEKVFVLLANSLQDHGMHVDMLLSTTSGKYFSLLDKNIRVVDFHSRQLFFTLPQLIGYLRTEKPDILLSAVENANTWALIAKKLSGSSTPVMITEHNNWSQILSHQPSPKEKLLFQIARIVYPWADRIVAVSNGIRTDLLQMIRLDPQQVICIFNPVVPLDLPSLTIMPVEHPWLKNKEKPVLISIGRLVLQKDFETLIQAFYLVKKQIDCRLIILGEGPERKNLQANIERLELQADIDMPGFVENPYAWMAKSDLFVMSSRYEGLPTVLIEAMACGTPVISTDCISGPAEILENGKYGDLVPVANPGTLADTIIKNINTSQSATSHLKERANAFSIANATNAYLATMEKLIRNE